MKPTRPLGYACLFLLLGVLLIGGCSDTTSVSPSQSQSQPPTANASATPTAAEDTLTKVADSASAIRAEAVVEDESTAPGSATSHDDLVREPATAQQAADILDLRSIALVEGAQEPTRRCIAGLSYQVKADSQQAFDFHRRMLIDDGWTELPGTRNDSGYASGTFSREGFVVSLSTSPTGRPDQPGEVNVSITNHGNTNLKRLPVPPGVKPFYTTPASIAYLTDATVDQTTQAVRQLLLDGGWKPYGSAGDSYFFKQNAVQISARIMSAPAQQGRTVITYSSEQYSYDLPAPEEAIGLQYTDSLRQLFFDHPGTLDDVVAYYRRELEPLGWKSTTENPVKMGFKMFLIFRDPRKDMLTMETHSFEGRTRVLIKHQTAEEVARLEQLAQEEIERQKQQRNQPKPKVAVPIPAGAKDLDDQANSIKFMARQGTGKALMEMYREHFKGAGWKEENFLLEALFGTLAVRNEADHSIDIDFVDTGLEAEFELTINGFGVDLEATPTPAGEQTRGASK